MFVYSVGGVYVFLLSHMPTSLPSGEPSGDPSGEPTQVPSEPRMWIEAQKLVAFDGAADDQFGYSVSVSGNVMLVSAAKAGATQSSPGSVVSIACNGYPSLEL